MVNKVHYGLCENGEKLHGEEMQRQRSRKIVVKIVCVFLFFFFFKYTIKPCLFYWCLDNYFYASYDEDGIILCWKLRFIFVAGDVHIL